MNSNSTAISIDEPPCTEIEPVTDILHGVQVIDPYRWLEDQNSQRTRAWLTMQERYTREYLDRLPGRDTIRARISDFLDRDAYGGVRQRGNRYFFSRRLRGEEQASILTCSSAGEPNALEWNNARVVVDPKAIAMRTNRCPDPISVSVLDISASGKLLAYAIREGGSRYVEVEILDVESGQLLPERLPLGKNRGFSFCGDTAILYVHEPVSSEKSSVHETRILYLGHPDWKEEDWDRQVFHGGSGDNVRLTTIVAGDRQHVIQQIVESTNDPRPGSTRTTLFVQNIAELSYPVGTITRNCPDKLSIQWAGDWILVVTDRSAPNRRICSMHRDRLNFEAMKTVVPERDVPIMNWCVAAGRLFVAYVEDLVTSIRVYSPEGEWLGEIQSPGPGTLHLMPAGGFEEDLFVAFESFTVPLRTYRYRPHDHGLDPCFPADPSTDGNYEIRKYESESKDGTLIPIRVIGKPESFELSGVPTLLTGYGGFGFSVTPRFSPFANFVIEQGGLFALATIRGGGEFGSAWHEAAKRERRQNAFDDFLSAAEMLVHSRLTSPGSLGIAGGSNSGLLVGAVLAQRPELFSVAICLAPLLDMLRYHLFGPGVFYRDEYGSSEDPDEFRALLSYSPYHNIRDGQAYPAFLMISGDQDRRCDGLHARKFIARLQAASSSEKPALLDYSPLRGHIATLPLQFRVESLADRIAFFCGHTGLTVSRQEQKR